MAVKTDPALACAATQYIKQFGANGTLDIDQFKLLMINLTGISQVQEHVVTAFRTLARDVSPANRLLFVCCSSVVRLVCLLFVLFIARRRQAGAVE